MFSPKDRETRKPRGFTFCQYRRKEDAADAVKGMDKRVGSLDRDFSHAPLGGWTGGMFCCCSLFCVSEHTHDTHDFSDTHDLCCGSNMSGPSLWGQSIPMLICLVQTVLSVNLRRLRRWEGSEDYKACHLAKQDNPGSGFMMQQAIIIVGTSACQTT